MAIEWPAVPDQSAMTVDIPDNYPQPPAGPPDVLAANVDCQVDITWTVPAPLSALLGGSFLLRAYAESIGPGQEIKLGEKNVAVVAGKTNYNESIPVPANTLKGEGEPWSPGPFPLPLPPQPVSGVYKVIAVLQHLDGANNPTMVSGFAEATTKMFRTP